MSLTADACGGPNPLVNLSQQLQSQSSYSYKSEAGTSSHSISDILNGLKITEKEEESSSVNTNWQREFRQGYTESASKTFLNGKIPLQTRAIYNTQPSTSKTQYTLPNVSKTVPNVSKTVLYNKAFESWVSRYYPELTYQQRDEVTVNKEDEPRAKLSKELADQWLKDFDLNQVLDVGSLSEAEEVIEQWIAEFTLGQNFTRPAYHQLLRAEDTYKEYNYMTKRGQGQAKELDVGIGLLREGRISEAVAVFEPLTCHTTGDVTGDVAGEAWYYLGLCHQHAEREEAAISAFREVPQGHVCYPSTLMALSTSYYNERRTLLATAALEEWITLKDSASTGTPGTVQQVRERFLDLAQQSDLQDVHLQTGLGVLCCLLEEHGKAVDCFKLAVSLCPEDHLLWNRLGATLANADRCSEAVPAYHRAVALCPGYVRARYNLGVACINLGAHREAVEHILTGLCHQSSQVLWETLRLALCLGSFYEHLQSADTRDLDSLVKQFNILHPS